MVEKIKINSRRYAKRQLTWFRKDSRIKWVKIDDFEKMQDVVDQIIGITNIFN
jgi:tRNA dimethylallyltransferase